MTRKYLVREREVEVDGECCKVSVYRYPGGRYCAQTSFSEEDIIVTDGFSQDEVFCSHCRILPLAVQSRRIVAMTQGELRPLA